MTLRVDVEHGGAGDGGQILLAASTASLVSDLYVVDLGLRSLRDLSAPVQLFQVRADGLRSEFPSLRTVDVVPGNLHARHRRAVFVLCCGEGNAAVGHLAEEASSSDVGPLE